MWKIFPCEYWQLPAWLTASFTSQAPHSTFSLVTTLFPGLDSADIVSRLRAAHAADPQGARTGVDILTGGLGDMRDRGIFEAFKVKNSVLMSATEAAEMILRVDDIIKAAPRQRQ